MTKPIYETWGSPNGRNGIQRTLLEDNEADRIFAESFVEIDEYGTRKTFTIAELNARGIRRCVAAMDIHTGEMKWKAE